MNDERSPEPADAPEATLVPLDDEGTFLVLGELPEQLEMDVLPLSYVRPDDVDRISRALAAATTWGNVGVQGAAALQTSAGLVRLAPETLQALRAGASPLMKDGWALGTLTKGGKFATSVRWSPAGGAAGVGPALAALGPALAIAAVQWQLTKIGKAVERNIELTRSVLDELRADAWYELGAMSRVVLDEARHGMEIGGVTDLMWTYLQAQSALPVLLKHRQRNRDDLLRKLDELRASERSADWYERNFADVIRHCQAVMTAQQAIAMHEMMRVAHARRSARAEDAILAERILSNARLEHDRLASEIDRSLRDLYLALALRHEAEPGESFAVNRQKIPIAELRNAVANLHSRAVAGPFTRIGGLPEPRVLTAQRVVDVADRERPGLERRLQWLLEGGETLQVIAKGSFRFGSNAERHLLVVTDRRALLVDNADLKSGRATTQDLPLNAPVGHSIAEGVERIELLVDGHSGVLRTKASEPSLFQVLRDLAERVTAVPATRT